MPFCPTALLQQFDVQALIIRSPRTVLHIQLRRLVNTRHQTARRLLLRSSAAAVFWPRWRRGWAFSWPGSAAGSPRSPAPSEGPGRPDADAGPPRTTCSPAQTHRRHINHRTHLTHLTHKHTLLRLKDATVRL